MITSKKIDICMTATIRPLILNETLRSFTQNMLTDTTNCRLIINIDPIGENVKRKVIIKTAKKYFKNIVFNCPPTPGFTKAVIWCFSQVTGDWVLHLEDDWKLLKPMNIDTMIGMLDKYPQLVSLRLDKENHRRNKHGIRYGFVYHPKISLNPTLFKGDFIKNVWKLMYENKNPEKQLRKNKSPLGKYIAKYTHGIYVKDGFGKIVDDIGRTWMSKSKYTKRTGFMHWENK